MAEQKSNLPAQLGTLKTVKGILDTGLPTIEEALPKGMDPTRFIRVVLTVLESNPKLLLCTRSSFFLAVLQCAELGLEPHLAQAYILPYRNKRNVGGKWVPIHEAQFQIGFRGLKELALRSGRYGNIEAQPVWEKDRFEYELGLNPRLVHVPFLDGDPGELRWAYSIAWPSSLASNPTFEVMSRTQLDHIRSKSKAKDDGPWVTDLAEMCRKSVFKRHAKWLELTPEMARVIERDNLADVGKVGMSASSLLTERTGLDETLREIGGEPLTEIEAPRPEPTTAPQALEAVKGASGGETPPPEEPPADADVEAERERQKALLEEAAGAEEEEEKAPPPAPSPRPPENPEFAVRVTEVPGCDYPVWVGDLPVLANLNTILRKITVPATILDMYSRDTRKHVRPNYETRLGRLIGQEKAAELLDGVGGGPDGREAPSAPGGPEAGLFDGEGEGPG